jgi:hypothetical protein
MGPCPLSLRTPLLIWGCLRLVADILEPLKSTVCVRNGPRVPHKVKKYWCGQQAEMDDDSDRPPFPCSVCGTTNDAEREEYVNERKRNFCEPCWSKQRLALLPVLTHDVTLWLVIKSVARPEPLPVCVVVTTDALWWWDDTTNATALRKSEVRVALYLCPGNAMDTRDIFFHRDSNQPRSTKDIRSAFRRRVFSDTSDSALWSRTKGIITRAVMRNSLRELMRKHLTSVNSDGDSCDESDLEDELWWHTPGGTCQRDHETKHAMVHIQSTLDRVTRLPRSLNWLIYDFVDEPLDNAIASVRLELQRNTPLPEVLIVLTQSYLTPLDALQAETVHSLEVYARRAETDALAKRLALATRRTRIAEQREARTETDIRTFYSQSNEWEHAHSLTSRLVNVKAILDQRSRDAAVAAEEKPAPAAGTGECSQYAGRLRVRKEQPTTGVKRKREDSPAVAVDDD